MIQNYRYNGFLDYTERRADSQDADERIEEKRRLSQFIFFIQLLKFLKDIFITKFITKNAKKR